MMKHQKAGLAVAAAALVGLGASGTAYAASSPDEDPNSAEMIEHCTDQLPAGDRADMREQMERMMSEGTMPEGMEHMMSGGMMPGGMGSMTGDSED